MPTLDMPKEEKPTGLDPVIERLRRGAGAIGADSRVSFRAMFFLLLAALAVSMAAPPWEQVGFVAIIGLTLEWARHRRRYPGPPIT